MTQLIQTTETMSSIQLREIINAARIEHGEPEVENRHFLLRIEDELEGELGDRKSFTHPQNHKQIGYYDLTRDQCTLVGMRESKGVRRNVLAKLKSMERKQPALPDFTDPVAAARAWADVEEQRQIATAQLLEQEPKIKVYERLAERRGDVSTTVIAKQLGTTAVKLNRWLREIGAKWLNADLPKAGYEDWFNVVSDVRNGHEFTQCLVTPAGQIEITKRWA